MKYEEAVSWLYGTQLHGIKLGLENSRRLAEALGAPVSGGGAPRFLHVAGTNGKGSACAMLDAICRAAGVRSGLFTSPHLVTFRERIRLNGEMISEASVASGLTLIRELTGSWEHSPTFFEVTTALALAYFQQRGAEVVVLETGMGGRLDATNIVTPSVSVITRIDLDHQQWLGASLPEIALEKAGIIKPGVPIVTAPQEEDVRCILVHLALERGAAYHEVITPVRRLPIALPGTHQGWNAALAVHALELAQLQVSSRAIAEGLQNVEWPGRFQRVGERLVLDGAHNPAAARQMVQTWREFYGEKKATLVLGVLRDKDVQAICAELAPIAARALIVPVQNDRTCATEDLARDFSEAGPGVEVKTFESAALAIEAAQTFQERVLVTGSLFLVGEALAHLDPQKRTPERSLQ